MENYNEQLIEEKVKSFIARKSKLVNVSDLNKDTKLFSSGLLDSLTFVELILVMESEFKIRFSDSAAVTMQTMDSITQVVQATLNALGPVKK